MRRPAGLAGAVSALVICAIVMAPAHLGSVHRLGVAAAAGAESSSDGASEPEEIDELIMESPSHIDDLWKAALKEYRSQILEAEGGRGDLCSKDEHCPDGKVCDRNGRCKPNNTDIDDACRYGLSTCLHKEGSAMRMFAEQETRERLGKLDKDEDDTGNLLQTALLPAPAQEMMALPPPPSLSNESSSEDESKVAQIMAQSSSGGMQVSKGMAAYVDSLALVDEVAEGALTASGALPTDTKQWMALAKTGKARVTRRPFYNHWDKEDRSWRVATATAEHKQSVNASRLRKERAFPNKKDEELMEWFRSKGGKIAFMEPAGRPDGGRRLKAVEDVSDGDLVLEVPLKLTLNQLTVRNIPTNQGRYLGHYLGGLFGKNQDWGLASLLLYELSKGNSSRWWPFIRTLNMHVLSKRVLRDLRGTYLAETLRKWEFEAEVMMKSIDKTVGEKDHMGAIKKWSTRKEMRWALWVVRRHGIWVTKVTTGKRIKALVPFANYLTHRRGSGGGCTVGLDNKIRVTAGAHEAGDQIYYEHGPYSDTETMLNFHTVEDVIETAEDNPHDRMNIKLPGARDMNAEDVFWEWTSTKEWRRFMKYPPKQSDLWRMANKLQLYGEEWDEDEQKAISASNAVISGLPLPADMVTPEEQLMLLGHASTEEEAQMIVYGGPRPAAKTQLYAVPDPEEDERAAKAIEEMADAMLQLQEAVAAGHTDPSVLKVINETKAFFMHGVQPKRGMDDIDKLMTRKRTMMDQCGNHSEHWVSKNQISPHLLCALRVHTMNETDMDIVCPMQKGAFWVSDPEDRKCEGGGFNWTLGISPENENATIQALRDTLTALLDAYPTTLEQDDAVLARADGLSPIRYSAVVLRRREKVLLNSVIDILDKRRENLGNLTYQIEEVRKKEEERKRLLAERAAWRKSVAEEMSKPREVGSISVDLGAKKVNFTWNEGESFDDAALRFGAANGLTYAGLDQLKVAAKQRIKPERRVEFFMPIVLGNGVRAALRVNSGDNATLVADQFCAKHNISEDVTERILEQVKTRHEKRMNRSLLLTFPIDAPDGRKLNFDVRQGEQHDLIRLVQDYALATNLNIDVEQLANIAHRKLPPQIMELPVDLAMQRRVILRVRRGDEPRELVEAFCEFFDIDPAVAGGSILTAVYRGLNPGAIVVPADPYESKLEDEDDGEKKQ